MRAVRLVIGILSILLGVGLVVTGIGAIQTFGTEGRLQIVSPKIESHDKAYALVMDLAEIDAGFPWSEQLGETTIGARSRDQKSLFIGLARTPQVDEYLSGVAYDVIRYESERWQTSSVPGIKRPGYPKDQKIWTRRSTGSAPLVQFKQVPGGNTTFVVMNLDASKGVTAQIVVGYKSSLVFPMAVVAAIVGGLLILVPLILGYRGKRKRARARVEPAVSMPATAPEQPEDATQVTEVLPSDTIEQTTGEPQQPPDPDTDESADEEPETPPNELDKWFRDGGQK